MVQYRYLTYDLNDDNYPDALVQMNWCDKSGCVWLLFQGSVDGYRFRAALKGCRAHPDLPEYHARVAQSGGAVRLPAVEQIASMA